MKLWQDAHWGGPSEEMPEIKTLRRARREIFLTWKDGVAVIDEQPRGAGLWRARWKNKFSNHAVSGDKHLGANFHK